VLGTRASLPSLTATLEQYLKPILTATGYLVPNWVGNIWLLKFDDEPLLFLIGVVCVAVTMLIGSSLEETIRSRAGEIWHASWCTVPNWAVDPKSLYKLRSNPSVIAAYRYFAWRALPTICLAACAALAAWLCWNCTYVAVYGALLMLAVAVRNWVFRAQYWTGKRRLLSTDRHSSQYDLAFRHVWGGKARSPLVT
jgi:hypothetical protein